MTHPTESAYGAQLSDHPHPRPALRRITGWLVALGLAGAGFGVIGLLILTVLLGLPLLPVMAVFLAALTVPLLQLTVMHPHVTVYERGLWIKPLLWSVCWVPWEAVSRVEDHTLIHRGQRTAREKPQDGRLIVVETGLPRLSAIVGGLAGLGWGTRAFGIASNSHVDYPALLNAIQRHKGRH